MNNLSENIDRLINEIHYPKSGIIHFLSENKYKKELIADPETWLQLGASIDLINDTLMVIHEYYYCNYPTELGLKYLYIYGLLQALFIQQDAVRNLTTALDIKYELNEELKKIRYVRNSTIGHPSREPIGKNNIYFNYIRKNSVDKSGFNHIRVNKNHELECKSICIDALVEKQLSELSNKLCEVYDNLESAHNRFDGYTSLSDIYPCNINDIFNDIKLFNKQDNCTFIVEESFLKLKIIYKTLLKEVKNKSQNIYFIEEMEKYINTFREAEWKIKENRNMFDNMCFYNAAKKSHKHFIKEVKKLDHI